jgi:F-type H+-transporting ATPase subunit a
VNFHIFEHDTRYPFAKFALTEKYLGVNLDTLTNTWMAMVILAITVFFIRIMITQYKNPQVSIIVKMIYKYTSQAIIESLGFFDTEVFNFILGVFFFTTFCNIVGVIPGIGEPTTDINTTLAIGVSCFLFAQYQGLKYKGFGYFTKFFSPVFILFPLNVIGQLAKIASLTFRLFGNILGGAIIWGLIQGTLQSISYIYLSIAGLGVLLIILNDYYQWDKGNKQLESFFGYLVILTSIVPALQFLFGICEGIIQAFVVALLTNIYIASERSKDGGH